MVQNAASAALGDIIGASQLPGILDSEVMKGVLSAVDNSLVTTALYGGKIDWQSAAAQALGSEIGNTLTTTLPNLDPKADYHKQNQAALAGNRQAAAVYGDATGRNGLGLQRQSNPANGLATYKDDAITSASNLTDTNGLNTRTSQGAATRITSGNPTQSSTTPAFQKTRNHTKGAALSLPHKPLKNPKPSPPPCKMRPPATRTTRWSIPQRK